MADPRRPPAHDPARQRPYIRSATYAVNAAHALMLAIDKPSSLRQTYHERRADADSASGGRDHRRR
jgi:hypothetical protein